MKCERCGSDLSGTSIMCQKCKHNNARQVVNNWRSKQVSIPAKGATRGSGTEVVAPPVIKPRGDADANLIRFPGGDEVATVSEAASASATDWRAQVKEKVRQSRQKRLGDEPPASERALGKNLEQNPLVQAALSRIKWAAPAPKDVKQPVYAASRGAAALAEALDPFPEIETFVDPPPTSKPVVPTAPRPRIRTNPFSYATTRAEKIEPVVEPQRRVVSKPPDLFSKPEPNHVAPPAARAIPKHAPKPDLLSYADVSTQTAEAPSVIPPLVPPPVLPVPVAPEVKPAPRIEAKETTPAVVEAEIKTAAARPAVKSESRGTQVIEIPSIISHMYEIVPAPATLWVRTLAGGCDLEILAMAFLPIFAAYATLNTSLGSEALFILGVLLSALVFVYQAVCLLIADRTFGMALLNLTLINTSDENMPVTRQQKLLRSWGATLAFLCPPLNLIILKGNRRGLSLPDLVSGTSPIEGK